MPVSTNNKDKDKKPVGGPNSAAGAIVDAFQQAKTPNKEPTVSTPLFNTAPPDSKFAKALENFFKTAFLPKAERQRRAELEKDEVLANAALEAGKTLTHSFESNSSSDDSDHKTQSQQNNSKKLKN